MCLVTFWKYKQSHIFISPCRNDPSQLQNCRTKNFHGFWDFARYVAKICQFLSAVIFLWTLDFSPISLTLSMMFPVNVQKNHPSCFFNQSSKHPSETTCSVIGHDDFKQIFKPRDFVPVFRDWLAFAEFKLFVRDQNYGPSRLTATYAGPTSGAITQTRYKALEFCPCESILENKLYLCWKISKSIQKIFIFAMKNFRCKKVDQSTNQTKHCMLTCLTIFWIQCYRPCQSWKRPFWKNVFLCCFCVVIPK